MAVDEARLKRVLGGRETQPLLEALVRRLADDRPLDGSITLRSLSAEESEAICAVLGRTFPAGRAVRIDLGALAAGLAAAGICSDLAEAVLTLRGPIASRRAESEAVAQRWDQVRGLAETVFGGRPDVATWMRRVFELGIVRRLSANDPVAAETFLRQLGLLLNALPANAEPLPALAARLYGNAHSLDPGSPLATLAVRLAARIGAVHFENTGEGRRAAWAGAGVICDELSVPVLVLNLRSEGSTALCRLLAAAADAGEPLHLSTRLLLRSPIDAQNGLRGREISVCENPALVELAARRLGASCAPLICVNGQFATAALLLLRMLRAAGARLRVHADFDPGGLMIARRVMTEGGAVPWRFSAVDYLAALKGVSLSGNLPPTPCNPPLREAMLREAKVVHEEAVAEDLLCDLMDRSAASRGG